MRKIAIIFLLSVITFSCSRIKKEQNVNFSNNTLHLCSNSLIINNKLNDFLDNYFNDNTLIKVNNYFLYVGQIKDTILLTVYPLKIDINMSKIHPMGIIRRNHINIFVLMSISNLVTYDTSNLVYETYLDAIKDIHRQKIKTSKIWMLKIPVYSDTCFIVKDRSSIKSLLSPTIKED